MKIKLEVIDDLTEDCITISCREITDEIIALQKSLSEKAKSPQSVELELDGKSYFVSVKEILFIETNGTHLAVHTKLNIYESALRLRDMEALLPPAFLRVSKSTIVNLELIQSVNRNLTGASEVGFIGTKKTTYVSRSYFKLFMDKMKERRL